MRCREESVGRVLEWVSVGMLRVEVLDYQLLSQITTVRLYAWIRHDEMMIFELSHERTCRRSCQS